MNIWNTVQGWLKVCTHFLKLLSNITKKFGSETVNERPTKEQKKLIWKLLTLKEERLPFMQPVSPLNEKITKPPLAI